VAAEGERARDLLKDHLDLEEAMGVAFRGPKRWPVPRSESEAKQSLGRLISDGTGENLARSGFEFALHVVKRMNLQKSANASLLDWANTFRASLRRSRSSG